MHARSSLFNELINRVAVSAGETLGPYELPVPIGKGGMGEVYRAHDPFTGRDVAIKISTERFSEQVWMYYERLTGCC